MQGSRTIISHLNTVLRDELTAINQYFLHARMLKNWGFYALDKAEYYFSIQAMKEADELIQRVLFLEGLPNLQDLGKLHIGQDVPEILRSDLAMESRARANVVAAIAQCEQEQDYVSRHELREILDHCEDRIDFYEMQLNLVDAMGVQNYLQSAVGESES